MRYKVLVTGKNDSAITAFFEQISDDFVILSTSTRYEDIVGAGQHRADAQYQLQAAAF